MADFSSVLNSLKDIGSEMSGYATSARNDYLDQSDPEQWKNELNAKTAERQQLSSSANPASIESVNDYKNNYLGTTGLQGYVASQMANPNQLASTLKNTPETNRRFFDENDELKKNPLDWNILGFSSEKQTSGPARDLYDYYFRQEDLYGAPEQNYGSFENGVINEDRSIDNGKSPESRSKNFMTGEQYLKYRNQFGIPGRPVEEIIPDELYSKQSEQDVYGFIPYLPTQESADAFHEEAAPHAIADAFNKFADARRNLTDYDINYDGKTYSGKDFSEKARIWDSLNSGKEGNIVYREDEAEEGAVPQTLVAYDENGEPHYAIGRPVAYEKLDNGGIIVKFNDNPEDDWVFEDQQDYETNLRWEPASKDDVVLAWMNGIEPLTLSDGSQLRADQVVDILQNLDDYADYGLFDIAKPYVENPVEEGGWLPWMIDMILSSSPYFVRPVAATKAIGEAVPYSHGFRPGYTDYLNNSYSLISEDPTGEQSLAGTLASLALPITEYLWGPLGTRLTKGPGPTTSFLNKVADKLPASAKGKMLAGMSHPIVKTGIGMSDEGIEEIFGNIVEEAQQNGFYDWYANDAKEIDESGRENVKRDSQGRAIKEETNPVDRFINFLKDAPLAYLAGAAMSGTLRFIPTAIETYNYMNNYRGKNNKNGSEDNSSADSYFDKLNDFYAQILQDEQENRSLANPEEYARLLQEEDEENRYTEWLRSELNDYDLFKNEGSRFLQLEADKERYDDFGYEQRGYSFDDYLWNKDGIYEESIELARKQEKPTSPF